MEELDTKKYGTPNEKGYVVHSILGVCNPQEVYDAEVAGAIIAELSGNKWFWFINKYKYENWLADFKLKESMPKFKKIETVKEKSDELDLKSIPF